GAPAVIGPTARTQVNTAVVPRFEGTRSGEHVLVRSDVVCGPDRAPALQIQALDPSVDPELTARCADDDAVPDHQGRHGHGLPIAHVGDLRAPQFPAGARLDRHGVPVEQVIDDLSVGVEGAAIDGVATGDADAFALTSGRYFHRSGYPSWVRSNAYSTFGHGVTTYMVSPT